MFSASSVCAGSVVLRYVYPWKWEPYVTSKRRDTITLWCSVISQKNVIISYTAATASKRVPCQDNHFPTKHVCSWVFRGLNTLKPNHFHLFSRLWDLKLSVARACHVKTISSSLSCQRGMKLSVTRAYHVKTNHHHFPINEVWSSVLLDRVTLTPHHHNHSSHLLPHRQDGRTYLCSHNTQLLWCGHCRVCGSVLHLLTGPQTVLLLITLRDSSFYRSIYVLGLKYECTIFHIIFCAKYSKLDAVAVRCGNVCRILLYSTQSESVTELRDETNSNMLLKWDRFRMKLSSSDRSWRCIASTGWKNYKCHDDAIGSSLHKRLNYVALTLADSSCFESPHA